MSKQTPSAHEIKAQLELILGDPTFSASDRLKQFFRFIVEETLVGHAGELKAYTIATSVFGRNKNFDPLLDPVVRVEAAKLRNKLMEYYFSKNANGQSCGTVRISVPKGSYVPTFSYLENMSAGSYAPASEHLEELEAKNDHLPNGNEFRDTEQNSGQKASANPDFLPNAPDSRTLSQLAVAVLPFVNLSRGTEKDYFINGLADEITVALTRFGDMTIVNSYSTRNINLSTTSLKEVGKALGVRFILHGSLQFCDEHIRVIAELTDAETGSNIWAERFEGVVSAPELFAIQDSIAEQVVSRIGDSFGSIRRKLLAETSNKRTTDLEVYEALLRYHHWLPTFNPLLFTQARQALEKAVERDPAYPVALAMLADLYASDYQLGYDTVPDALDKAQEFSMRAIALDASSQTAHWALALTFFLRRNKTQFAQAIAKVVPLNPANSYMLVATGLLVGMALDIEDGMALMSRALQLNPCSPGWYRIVPYFKHYRAGNYEAALNEALLINTLDCYWDPMLRAAAYGQLGRKKEAQTALAELLKIQPDFEANHQGLLLSLTFSEDCAEELEEGLRKAGLAI